MASHRFISVGMAILNCILSLLMCPPITTTWVFTHKMVIASRPIYGHKSHMTEKERVHFKIAIPVDLKQTLEHFAVENRRSLSAEIIARLEASLGRGPSIDETGAPIVTAEVIPGNVWAKFAELVATVEENSKDIKTLIEKTRADK
ncbi:Arc family DNA-binding protein [Brucella pseudintermedia]|nr:Arc family DNA-binding protein [Brucella pseudintermedia]